MTWESRYLPPDPTPWQGRIDVPPNACFFQHIQLINLLDDVLTDSQLPSFALIGFKSDEGVQRDLGRSGAFEGPIAIRQRLNKLPIHRQDIRLLDVGNIVCIDHDMEQSQQALADVVAALLAKNICPIVLGGSHELAWGQYQGIMRTKAATKKLGIVNFDANFDLHPLEPANRSSATTAFFQMIEAHRQLKTTLDYYCLGIQSTNNIQAFFDLAKQLHTQYLLADELHSGQAANSTAFIDRLITQNELLYASLSLDVFSPAFAPGVSAIQPLGLTPWHVIPLLRQLAGSGKVLSYDIAELVPRYDIDHRTAKLAATLIYEIIHHHTPVI